MKEVAKPKLISEVENRKTLAYNVVKVDTAGWRSFARSFSSLYILAIVFVILKTLLMNHESTRRLFSRFFNPQGNVLLLSASKCIKKLNYISILCKKSMNVVFLLSSIFVLKCSVDFFLPLRGWAELMEKIKFYVSFPSPSFTLRGNTLN